MNNCTCNVALGQKLRVAAINNAKSEDDYHAAAESHWSEYVEPCPYCTKLYNDAELDMECPDDE